ncbi:hypothetical protein MNEG_6661, partial [Monoraphidium neglectum]
MAPAAPAPRAAVPAVPSTAEVLSAAPPDVEQVTRTLITLLKKSKGRGAAHTLSRAEGALAALTDAGAADTSTPLPGALLQDLLASAPGFLARAIACLSSANDATATAAAGALAMLSAFEPEACALILREGDAMQALLTLMDSRRSGASPDASANALNCLAHLGTFGGEAPLRRLAGEPAFVDAACARVAVEGDACAYAAARALHAMVFLPAECADRAAGNPAASPRYLRLLSASLAPRHWRAMGAQLIQLLRAAAAPQGGGGRAAARVNPDFLQVAMRMACDGISSETARVPLLETWAEDVPGVNAAAAAGAPRQRGVLIEALIREPDAVLWLARLASSGSPVVDPT